MSRIAHMKVGPLFTPPSIEGTVTLPGLWGCVNWGGGAFWPNRHLLITKTSEVASASTVVPSSPLGYTHEGSTELISKAGLPVSGPPFGRLVAVDIAAAAIRWATTFGDWTAVRENPELAGVGLPPIGVPGPPGPISWIDIIW